MKKLTLDRKVELLKSYYSQLWFIGDHDSPLDIVLDGDGTHFDLSHTWDSGENRVVNRQYLVIDEDGYLEPTMSDGHYDIYTERLFLVDSANYVDLCRHWLESEPNLEFYYGDSINEVRDKGFYIIACVPNIKDPAFCTIVTNCRDGVVVYIHADDGSWRVSSSPQWDLMPQDDPKGETHGLIGLPSAGHIANLFGGVG